VDLDLGDRRRLARLGHRPSLVRLATALSASSSYPIDAALTAVT
jgi:hypothetical protein